MKRFFQSRSKLIRVLLPVFLVISSFGFLYAANVFNVKAQTNSILKSIFLAGNESGEVVCDGKMSFTIDQNEPGKLIINCDGEAIGNIPTPTPEVQGTHDHANGGLTGTYFHNKDFTDFAFQRLDTTVNFSWNQGSPDPSVDPNTFSVIWNGFIHAPHAGEYTFYTSSDDGIRLWVNDQEIVSNWTDHPETQNSGKIILEADKWYPITMQFYENTGGAVVKLLWSHAQIQKQIIPSEHLAPESEDVEPTTAPSPTPNATPTASPQVQGEHSTGGLGVGSGDGLEVGIKLAKFNELKTEAQNGDFDRECTPEEHDPEVWHTLVNEEAGCHYNHHHGDDPNYVNDLFGEPGTWFQIQGQSISYPWQTFALPATATNQEALGQLGTEGQKENDLKHEGYFWVVRRNQPCPNGGPCVTDFRIQTHGMFFAHGAAVRWHSASMEVRVCDDINNPSTCGISREGGWFDFGVLSNSPNGSTHAAANDSSLSQYLINLANYDQFSSISENEGLQDEVRHHQPLSAATISRGPRVSDSPKAEWWAHGGLDSRFQFRVMDPIGNIEETTPGSGELKMLFNCPDMNVNCRWNQSIFTLQVAYVYNLNSYHLDGAENVVNMPYGEQFVSRFGGVRNNCADVSLDCIPSIFENVVLNLPDDGSRAPYWGRYSHTMCDSCDPIDHDITPTDRPSWITWFHRYADHH